MNALEDIKQALAKHAREARWRKVYDRGHLVVLVSKYTKRRHLWRLRRTFPLARFQRSAMAQVGQALMVDSRPGYDMMAFDPMDAS